MTSQGPLSYRNRLLLGMLLVAATISFLIFRPFLGVLVLAWITAGVARPLHSLYLRWFGKREGPAAAASLLTVILVVIVPFTLMVVLLVREGIGFVQYAQANLDGWIQGTLAFIQELSVKMPFLRLETAHIQDLLPRVLDQALKFAMTLFNSVTGGGSQFVFQGVVFLFCLYYFFSDWQRFGDWITRLSPLEARHNRLFFSSFLSMGRSVLKSTLLLGILQGVLGGLALAVIGVPSPVFWGAVMVFLSLLPVVGAVMVLLPAGLIVALSGRPLAGIGLMLFGVIVVSNVDNLLRPRLVGGETALHPLAVFLSTLGGLVLFGVSGFILGPVAIALVASLLRVYQEELRPLLVENENDEPAAAQPAPSSSAARISAKSSGLGSP